VRDQRGQHAGGHAHFHRLAPAEQHHRHLGTQGHARSERTKHAGDRAQQQRPRLEARYDEHVGGAGNLRVHAVGVRGGSGERAVRGQRPVDHSAGNHALGGHLGQRRRVRGRGQRGRHALDGAQHGDQRRRGPDRVRKIDRVLHDVAFGRQRGRNIEQRIGENERAGITWRVDEKGMGEPPLPAQAGFRRGDGAHQVVGVEAALDERPHLTLFGELRSALGSRKGLIRRVDQVDARQVEARLGGSVGDATLRPDQHRRQVAGELSGQRDLQRITIAGIDDRRRKRWQIAGPISEPLEVGATSH
jgi:hypothetical protein